MNPFTERYKTLSNPDLLKIIDNPVDYQPIAVEAAQVELSNRQLNNDELASAKAKNDLEAQKRSAQIEKKEALENKLNDLSGSVIDAIHPIHKGTLSAPRVIKIMSLVFTIMFLFGAFNQFDFIKFMLTNKNAKWDFGTLVYFIPLIFTPIATFLFWHRRKLGWILFCTFFTYSALNTAALAFKLVFSNHAANSQIDSLFPSASPSSFIWNILFYSAYLWLLFKIDIRKIYKIDKRTMLITTGLGVILTVITIVISIS
jgi:hypothetical protein